MSVRGASEQSLVDLTDEPSSPHAPRGRPCAVASSFSPSSAPVVDDADGAGSEFTGGAVVRALSPEFIDSPVPGARSSAWEKAEPTLTSQRGVGRSQEQYRLASQMTEEEFSGKRPSKRRRGQQAPALGHQEAKEAFAFDGREEEKSASAAAARECASPVYDAGERVADEPASPVYSSGEPASSGGASPLFDDCDSPVDESVSPVFYPTDPAVFTDDRKDADRDGANVIAISDDDEKQPATAASTASAKSRAKKRKRLTASAEHRVRRDRERRKKKRAEPLDTATVRAFQPLIESKFPALPTKLTASADVPAQAVLSAADQLSTVSAPTAMEVTDAPARAARLEEAGAPRGDKQLVAQRTPAVSRSQRSAASSGEQRTGSRRSTRGQAPLPPPAQPSSAAPQDTAHHSVTSETPLMVDGAPPSTSELSRAKIFRGQKEVQLLFEAQRSSSHGALPQPPAVADSDGTSIRKRTRHSTNAGQSEKAHVAVSSLAALPISRPRRSSRPFPSRADAKSKEEVIEPDTAPDVKDVKALPSSTGKLKRGAVIKTEVLKAAASADRSKSRPRVRSTAPPPPVIDEKAQLLLQQEMLEKDLPLSLAQAAQVYRLHFPPCAPITASSTSPPIKCKGDHPNCLHLLGYKRRGMWASSPPHLALLGSNPTDNMRAEGAYVGLKNQGATCYGQRTRTHGSAVTSL